jgi:hypothetical protein
LHLCISFFAGINVGKSHEFTLVLIFSCSFPLWHLSRVHGYHATGNKDLQSLQKKNSQPFFSCLKYLNSASLFRSRLLFHILWPSLSSSRIFWPLYLAYTSVKRHSQRSFTLRCEKNIIVLPSKRCYSAVLWRVRGFLGGVFPSLSFIQVLHKFYATEPTWLTFTRMKPPAFLIQWNLLTHDW